MKQLLVAYLIGIVFGLGITFSGMINPAKVLNFFDVAGHWDPSLAFVMLGALMVTALGYRWVLSRKAPQLSPHFSLPTRHDIDRPLLTGAVLFGLGWGIAGVCPGAAIPALGTGRVEIGVFVLALILGLLAARCLRDQRWHATHSPDTEHGANTHSCVTVKR